MDLKSTVRAVCQPVDTRKYEARAGKRGISPLAERAALRALKEGARAPGGRVWREYYILIKG